MNSRLPSLKHAGFILLAAWLGFSWLGHIFFHAPCLDCFPGETQEICGDNCHQAEWCSQDQAWEPARSLVVMTYSPAGILNHVPYPADSRLNSPGRLAVGSNAPAASSALFAPFLRV